MTYLDNIEMATESSLVLVFSSYRVSSQPRNQTQVSHIAGGFFTSWVTREAQENWSG